MISCPPVRRVFLQIPSSRMCAWREPQGTCSPFLTHRHHLFSGFSPARLAIIHSSCVCFSAFEIFWLPKGIPALLQTSNEAFGATRKMPALALLGPRPFIHCPCQHSHCLSPSLFSDKQNLLILWHGRSDNEKERLNLRYSLNRASTGLGN